MPQDFSITNAFSQQYTTNIQLLVQQRGSRLSDAVSMGSYVGEGAKAVEQIGSSTAVEITSRHGDTPLTYAHHDARWIYPTPLVDAKLIDSVDKLKMIIDPTSSYALSQAYALGRGKDKMIISAFTGICQTGQYGNVSTPFPASQQIASDVGSSSATGMNVAKLRAAMKMLLANDVDTEYEPIYCVMEAEQHDNLLAETQTTSLDFNTRPVLVEGRIKNFMGMNFIILGAGKLQTNSSSERRCIAWAKSGMHLGIWDEIKTRITEESGKNFSTQLYSSGTWGSSRIEEKKVVEIPCAE